MTQNTFKTIAAVLLMSLTVSAVQAMTPSKVKEEVKAAIAIGTMPKALGKAVEEGEVTAAIIKEVVAAEIAGGTFSTNKIISFMKKVGGKVVSVLQFTELADAVQEAVDAAVADGKQTKATSTRVAAELKKVASQVSRRLNGAVGVGVGGGTRRPELIYPLGTGPVNGVSP